MFDPDTNNAPYPRPLFQGAPMLRIALAVCLGIVIGNELAPMRIWVTGCAVLLGLTLMVLAMPLRRSNIPFRVALWFTFTSMGILLFTIRQPVDPFPPQENGLMADMSVTLTDTPVSTPKCYKVAASIDSLNGHATRGNVMLFVRQDNTSQSLAYGDKLRIQARLERPSESIGDDNFNYRQYLYRRGITWQCYVPSHSWSRLASKQSNTLKGYAKQLQLKLVNRIQNMPLTPSQQGIAEALVLGWKSDLDEITKQQYRQAGIMHLLCVSGLHVGLVAMIIGCGLFFVGRLRWQRLLKGSIQLACIWGFVLISGMSAATLRAGVMFSLILVGDMIERSSNTLNNLATSALLLVFINPMALFDVGFQLSYTAVLGIALWHKPLVGLIPQLHSYHISWCLLPISKIWSWTCLSTSAQLAVLPLTLFYFHQFPLYFLVANLTVVPFAGVMLVSVMGMTASGGNGALVGLVSQELDAVDGITSWISTLPHAMVDNIYFDLPMALMLSAALGLFSLFLRQRRYWALPAAIACLILLVLHYYGVLYA